MPCSNIRKIRPFLTEQAAELLISRLYNCNALIVWLPTCAVKHLQMIQKAAAHLMFNEPKKAHITTLYISLHCLPVAARIKFKTLMHLQSLAGLHPFQKPVVSEWVCDSNGIIATLVHSWAQMIAFKWPIFHVNHALFQIKLPVWKPP